MQAWVTTAGKHTLEKRPVPVPTGRDLLIHVEAAAVNPVDYKLSGGADKAVLGFDGSGIVTQLGPKASSGFKVGDEVWFAGNYKRGGSYAEYVLIDERIVSKKPTTLSFTEAAAFPLVTLTAWEAFEEGMRITHEDSGKTILIIGGAGGLGSASIQIAKQQFNLRVVATASRPESREWCTKLGADLVIDHTQPLKPQLGGLGIDYLFCTEDKSLTWDQWGDIMNVLGKIQLITAPNRPVSLSDFFAKRITVGLELMFTRPLFDVDQQKQGAILNRMAHLVDSGRIQKLDSYHFKLEDMPQGLKQIETGRTIGKIVFTGFGK